MRLASLPSTLLLSTLLSACHGARTVPVSVPAAPACPAPVLDVTANWQTVVDSFGVSYRLPPGFVPYTRNPLPYRRWDMGGASGGYLSIGFNHTREHWTTLRRAPSPGMHEMSECLDSIWGREILVQSWRTANGIFRSGRRYDRYDVFALLPLEPGLTVFLGGGGSDRAFQTTLLTIARTFNVPEP